MKTRPVRVLIVDDQKPFREAARLVVSISDGFEVAGEAATGEEAVQMANDLAPDLVLMDINLPGIDGIEATRRILKSQPNVRVIVLSTYEAGEYERRAIEAGAVAFISKSDFDPESLNGWVPNA
jgi:DNA-binding NarL/FixJ family response regulator